MKTFCTLWLAAVVVLRSLPAVIPPPPHRRWRRGGTGHGGTVVRALRRRPYMRHADAVNSNTVGCSDNDATRSLSVHAAPCTTALEQSTSTPTAPRVSQRLRLRLINTGGSRDREGNRSRLPQ